MEKAQDHSRDIEDLTADHVLTWVENQQVRGLAQKIIRTRVVSVKAFTRCLVEDEWLPRDPLELVSLQRGDVDWDKGLIAVRGGKGGKFRVVPLGVKGERALTR